jgi:hypothetical protein
MENLGELTMNELLELAQVAKHKREKHNEAMKRYYAKNMDKWRETWRNQKRKKKQEQKTEEIKEVLII